MENGLSETQYIFSYHKGHSQVKRILNNQRLSSEVPIFVFSILFISVFTFMYVVGSPIFLFTNLVLENHPNINTFTFTFTESVSVAGLASCPSNVHPPLPYEQNLDFVGGTKVLI